MRLIRRNDLTARPWKNGGGVTWQIASDPEAAGLEDFDWRISMAEVASDGPFSAFPGVDRTLTLLDGAGIVLDFAGVPVRLDPGAPPLSFPGEALVAGRPLAGPILDLNVMTRRGRCIHAVLPAAGTLPDGTIAVVARGPGRVGDSGIPPFGTLLSEPVSEAAGGRVPQYGTAGDLAGLPAQGDLLAVVILPVQAAR